MAEVRYIPAAQDGWRVAVAERAVAVLAPAVTPPTAEAVWRSLDDAGIGGLVEALTGAFGTSLTAIPPFALIVVEDDGVRVAVRGPIDLLLEGAQETLSVSGQGVATWAERLLPNAHRVTASMQTELDDATSLPIVSGIVAAGGVVLAVDAPRAPAVVAPPAVAPVPAGESDAAAVAAGAPDAASDVDAESRPSEPTNADTWIPATTQAPDPELIADVPLADVPRGDVPRGDMPRVDIPRADMPKPGVASVPDSPADDSTIAASRSRTPAAAPAVPDDVPWASTVVRPPAAPPPPSGPPAAAPPLAPQKGDHDGATISVAEARALRGDSAPSFEPVGDVPPRHPARGRVRLADGRVVELERPVVIGRRPRSTRASGAELPTLIAVDSPEGDISRSHVEIRGEGEHVLVTDLATTNGTVLRRVGQDPVRLHPNEPSMVVSGDVLDLGDGVTVTFEDLP